MIQFDTIFHHTHKGKRDYQEDCFAFGGNYLIISDGVGGHAKGNIASEIVVDTWRWAFENGDIRLGHLEEDIDYIIGKNIDALNYYAQKHPESQGMGATLACLAVIEGKPVSIHIGDSRTYIFSKDGNIKWKTKDHSLVQELIDGGILTEESAATHPKRNIITRVLQAKEDYKTRASIKILDDIAENDIALVCSDGVIESWDDVGLMSVLQGGKSIENALKVIGEHCAKESSDNNTAIIASISVSKEANTGGIIVNPSSQNEDNTIIEQNVPRHSKQELMTEKAEILEDGVENNSPLNDGTSIQSKKANEKVETTAKSKIKFNKIVLAILVLLLVATLGYFASYYYDSDQNNNIITIDKSDTKAGEKTIDQNTANKNNAATRRTPRIKEMEKINDEAGDIHIIDDHEDGLFQQFNRNRTLGNAELYLQEYPDSENALKILSFIDKTLKNNQDANFNQTVLNAYEKFIRQFPNGELTPKIDQALEAYKVKSLSNDGGEENVSESEEDELNDNTPQDHEEQNEHSNEGNE